jgi:tape measure domain-containing protein
MSARGIEAARAFVRIYAEDSRLKQSLTGIRGQFQRLNASLSGPAVQAAMAGLVAAGAGVVKVAMDMERVGVAFRVMIGDAEKSQQLLKDIADMARTSPLSIAQYQQAGQTLLQFGMQAGQVLPVLDSLGNIASGDGEKLSRLALAFGQMQAAGRLMGQDLLQMINAGFNPLQEISERTGESMESLKKRMSEGAVSAAEVTKSFRAATGAGGRFAGMNEEISQTAAGVFATLQSEVYELAIAMGNVLLPTAKGVLAAMRGITSVLSNMPKGLVAASTAVIAFVAAVKAVTIALSMYAKAQAIAQGLSGPKGWATLAAGVVAAGAALVVLNAAEEDYIQKTRDSHNPMAGMAGDLSDIAGSAGAAGDALDSAKAKLLGLRQQVDDSIDPVASIKREVAAFRRELEAELAPHWLEAGVGDTWVNALLESKAGLTGMMQDLTDEIAILGGQATQTELALARMASAGVDPKRIGELRALIAERDRLAQQQEAKDYYKQREEEMSRAAENVRLAVEDVQTTFAREQKRLGEMVSAGLLTQAEADQFLAQNPEFAALMGGEKLRQVLQTDMKAQDIRTVSGASAITKVINGQQQLSQRQVELLTQQRELTRRLVTVTEKGLVAYGV